DHLEKGIVRNRPGGSARMVRGFRGSGGTREKTGARKLAERTHPPKWQRSQAPQSARATLPAKSSAFLQKIKFAKRTQMPNWHTSMADKACPMNPDGKSRAAPQANLAKRTQADR